MHFDVTQRRRGTRRPLIGLTPLIDVVFILLIFFMLAGELAASDPFEVAPPYSTNENEISPRDLVVFLGADGTLAVGDQIVERNALAQAVAAQLNGEAPPGVWLKADGEADSTEVIAVMEVLRAAGIERLKIVTQLTTGGGE